MNKKGFTVIELITTFALSTVIIIILINVVLMIKNIYSENNIKSELLIEQSNLSNLINKKFTKDNLKTYEACNDSSFCYKFEFVDGTTSTLVVGDDYIKFDSYKYKIKSGTSIGESKLEITDVEVSSTEVNNSILVIKIPIINKIYPNEDFGINLVYQYNSNKITL